MVEIPKNYTKIYRYFQQSTDFRLYRLSKIYRNIRLSTFENSATLTGTHGPTGNPNFKIIFVSHSKLSPLRGSLRSLPEPDSTTRSGEAKIQKQRSLQNQSGVQGRQSLHLGNRKYCLEPKIKSH